MTITTPPADVLPSVEIAASIRARIEELDTYVRLAGEERALLVEAMAGLEQPLETPSIADETPAAPKKRVVSAQARANMAAAQRARWERERASDLAPAF